MNLIASHILQPRCLDSTGGKEKIWKADFLWLTNANECLWFTGGASSTCDQDDSLIALDLGENNLVGSLPAEIGLLTSLSK